MPPVRSLRGAKWLWRRSRTVWWAKAKNRDANASRWRAHRFSRRNPDQDGGHGARAPLPTLRPVHVLSAHDFCPIAPSPAFAWCDIPDLARAIGFSSFSHISPCRGPLTDKHSASCCVRGWRCPADIQGGLSRKTRYNSDSAFCRESGRATEAIAPRENGHRVAARRPYAGAAVHGTAVTFRCSTNAAVRPLRISRPVFQSGLFLISVFSNVALLQNLTSLCGLFQSPPQRQPGVADAGTITVGAPQNLWPSF